MQAFHLQDAQSPPPADPVLFVGSSTIRLWDVRHAFPEVPVINRGFGGSQVRDVIFFYDRLIKRYRPRTIVFYSGDNDLAGGRSPDRVVADMQELMGLIRRDFPQSRIVLLGVKPCPARWRLFDKVHETNQGFLRLARADRNTVFIDLEPGVLGVNGRPRNELFSDGLHFSSQGYAMLNKAVRPYLLN